MDLIKYVSSTALPTVACSKSDLKPLFSNAAFKELTSLNENEISNTTLEDLCTIDTVVLQALDSSRHFLLFSTVLKIPALLARSYKLLIIRIGEAYVIQFLDITENSGLNTESDHYRLMFENAPLAYQSLDESGHILDVNPMWLKILGYDSKEEVLGRWFGDFLQPDFIPYFKKNFPVFKKNGCIHDARFKMKSKTGKLIYISFEGNIGFNKNGSFRQTYCVFKDITTTVEIEKKLSESEMRYRSLFEESGSVMLILDPDSGQIEDANKKACEFYGYTKETLLSMSIYDINLLPPEDIKRKMKQVLDHRNGILRFEHKLSDGSTRHVEVFSGSIIISEKEFLYSIINDVSEKTEIENELRILSQAIDQSPSSILITDNSGNIEYVNPRFTQLTQYPLEEIAGKTPSFLKSGYTSQDEYKELWQAIQNGETWHGVFKNIRKDGESFWEDATIGPIYGEDGSISHFLGVKKDITQQKEMEAQISHMQKMESISHLTGGIAHDFNNLLTIIQGNAELIQVSADSDPEIQKHIDAINEASDRAAALTKQMLLFSRNENMNVKKLDLKNYLPGIIQLIEFDVPDNIKFKTRIDRDLYCIKGDISNIEQAVLNLCNNAIDAMPGGGEMNLLIDNITIDENDCEMIYDSKPGNYILIQIEDTGIGIAKEHLSKIFDPFYSLKDEPQGHGMGLAVVYGIIKIHQGWINVYSEPDHGSVFKVYLPAVTASQTEVKSEGEKTPIPKGNKERILLIEDEDGIRNFCRISLEKYGYSVDEANSGELAELLFNNNNGKYDLILSDVILPDINGFDLVQKFKKKNPGLKVIMNSGYSEERSRHREITGQGVPFIQKPFKLKDLVLLIQETLA